MAVQSRFLSSGGRCSSCAALSPSGSCGSSRWSHSPSPPTGRRRALAGTRCCGGPATPSRTGPRRPARGCASGRCPARLLGGACLGVREGEERWCRRWRRGRGWVQRANKNGEIINKKAMWMGWQAATQDMEGNESKRVVEKRNKSWTKANKI